MFFTSPATAQLYIIFVVFILGFVLSIIGSVLRLIPTTTVIYVDVLRYIFALFPPFALGEGLNNLVFLTTLSIIELKGTNLYSPGDWKITGLNLTFLAWETVVYLGGVIAFEYLREMPLLQCKQKNDLPTDLSLRDDGKNALLLFSL